MLPHPINMVRVRLSGVKLKEIIAKSNKQEYMYEHAQGLGFRGNIFGGYILYNLVHSFYRALLSEWRRNRRRQRICTRYDRYVYVRSLFQH